jgi:hypothetical protein
VHGQVERTLGSSLKLICGGDRESGPPGPLLPVVDRRGTTSDLSDVNLPEPFQAILQLSDDPIG